MLANMLRMTSGVKIRSTITYGVSVWRTIKSLWNQLVRDITFKVGSGTRIKFWNELWIGQNPLMVSYPDLFILSSNQDALVNEV